MKPGIGMLLAASLVLPAWAGVTNVTSGGPLYASLTQAVEQALSGDELHVSTGAYFGNLLISGKHVSILGGYTPDFAARVFEPEQTVISTSGVAPVVFIDAGARVLLEAVRITGGGVFLLWGGGVFIGDNCLVTARYCRIDRNVSLFGGGAAVWSNAVLVVHASWVDHNTALLEGGGIYGFLAARVALHEPVACFDNWAPRGGGMTLYGAALTSHGPCDFDNNIAVERGGALYLFNGARADIAPHAKFGWTTPNLVTNGDGGCVYAESSTFTMRGNESTITSITGSRATRDGGAIYLSNSICTLADYVELAGPGATNTPGLFGGGIYALDSHVTLSNSVRIHSCAAAAGGAIAAQRSTLILRDRVAIGDTNFWLMNFASAAGGGIYAYLCTTLLTDVQVVYNGAQQGFGGGLCILGTGVCTITDSIIANNLAGDSGPGGGGIGVAFFAGSLVLDHVIVTGNTAVLNGGGISWHGSGAFTAGNGSEFTGNRAMLGHGGAAFLDGGGPHVLRDLDVSANVSGDAGGGLCMQSNNVTCTACVFTGNRAVTEPVVGDVSYYGGGAVAALPGSVLAAYNCVWRDNYIANNYGSGGALYGRGSTVTVASTFATGVHAAVPPTQFVGNRAGVSNSAGGAVFLYEGAAGSCAHAFFASNRAVNGGGIAVQDSSAMMDNLVIAQNHADGLGGGMMTVFPRNEILLRQCTLVDNDKYGCEISGGTARFQNCILWGNLYAQIAPWSETAMVTYCDIEGGYAGAGNIDSNPLFVAAAALNYDIAADSPCRDAGMNLPTITNDCIGTPRPYGPAWDMGAYEFVPEPAGLGLLGLFTICNLQFRIWQRRRRGE